MITAGTFEKMRFFDSSQKLDIFRETTFALVQDYRLTLQAWAFLANHYHLVFGTSEAEENFSFRSFLRHLHRDLGRRLNEFDETPGRRVMYQYWDSALTYEKSWLARLHYVHYNPVHHGLVKVARDYPWCSAAWFETNASPAFVKSVYSFKLDRVNVQDDF